MIFLLLNLALGFYNLGTIWAHEVDIFRSWQHVGGDFYIVQEAHWKKAPYWVLGPVVLALAGSIALIWVHPAGSPTWAIAGVAGCQVLSIVLTALYWSRWQAELSRDPRGDRSPYLRKIIETHWIRTALTTVSAVILLVWTIQM